MDLFDFIAPTTIEELVEAKAHEGAWLLAGGTDLLPQLKEGRRKARLIVDCKHVPELTQIKHNDEGEFFIGAAASATTIAKNHKVRSLFPAIAASAKLIGSRQIQNRATLGGNICNAAPSADGIASLICYQAEALLHGPKGQRRLAIEDLFSGPGTTTLGDNEVLIALLLPPPPEMTAAAYQRFTPRREMDIAVAGVGSLIQLDDDQKIAKARISLASVAPVPLLSKSVEKILIGETPSEALFEEAGAAAAQDASPISDTRGSADYRRHLVSILCRRTLAIAFEELAKENLS